MRTVEELAATPDPKSRASAAAAVVRQATTAADRSRARRDAAAMCLIHRYGARPVEVQNRMGVARNAYVRLRRRYPSQ